MKAVIARATTEPDEGDPIKLATKALTQLGYPPNIATSAVDTARVNVGDAADLEVLIRQALRHCT